MIAHDGVTLVNHNAHGDIIPREPFDLPLVREKFFGVRGESHVIGEPQGRTLDCRALMYGYVSPATLDTALAALNAQAGQLTGDIAVTGSMTRTESACTFMGVQKLEPGIRLDGSGVNGYLTEVLLVWIQRNEGA